MTKSRRRRKRRQDKSRIIYILVFCAIVMVVQLVARNCETMNSGPIIPGAYRASELEEVVIPDEQDEIKVDYTGFRVSFNPAHRIPNYVVWELTRDEANGQVARKNDFHPDPNVYGCPSLSDYKRSGFDRGHMAPAADMKWNERAMYDSHVLTNMCPQDNSINTGRWNSIEKLERRWAQRDSALIIIAGPVLSDEITRTIGKGVSVPERFFKVMLAPFANPPRAIGFIVPNSPTEDGVERLCVSVDEVEAVTGYDFFSALPDEVENEVERSSNFKLWQRLK